VSFIFLCAGVVLLTRTVPETMTVDDPAVDDPAVDSTAVDDLAVGGPAGSLLPDTPT
jgi:hypothetical protein